jgi:peptidyl-prolyl cis-trans isomerase A (cyclophilin A)
MNRLILTAIFTSVFHVTAPSVLAAEVVTVQMQTSAGNITLELYPDAAPLTVANFLNYVGGHFYDQGSFYRAVRTDNQAQNNIRIEVIQGGLNQEPEDLPFEPIAHETTADTGIRHTNGVISMARLQPGTASSEFFICINDQPELDFGGMRNPDGQGFAAFGRVVSGMNVVRAIQQMKTDTPPTDALEYTSGQILLEPVRIEQVTRLD